MSTTSLKFHPLITSITINGNVITPDGSGNAAVASADASAIFRGTHTPTLLGPIQLNSPPTDPTT